MSISETRWSDLPIICPGCGNHGEDDGRWTTNAPVPFKLIEDVIRSWRFSAAVDEHGKLRLVGDTASDKVDWESGTNLGFECMACFDQFAIPEGANVDFE